MTIDLSAIHPCPNCKSKPRVTGVSPAKLPVKIRCSNKNCELSRQSVPTEFWQAIRRDISNDVLEIAYGQFEKSLRTERSKNNEIIGLANDLLDLFGQSSCTDEESAINTAYRGVPLRLRNALYSQ